MYERNRTVPAIPSWIVTDSRHRQRYFLAGSPPGKIKPEWIEQGFVIQAETIAELEKKCEITPGGLKATIKRFNEFSRTGHDEDFNRGRSKWDNFLGDATVAPNPNLGEISKPPFYAIKAFPGDVGTFGGLVTDENARVLRSEEHTSELQSLMRISYAVFCLKKKKNMHRMTHKTKTEHY